MRRLGGSAARIQTEEAYRDRQGFPLLESVWQDMWYGVRGLRRQPVFSVVVLLVLGTTIGLNTSLFTLSAGLLFRPWSGISDPSRVVTIYSVNQSGQAAGFPLASHRYFGEHATTLSGITAMRTEQVDIGVDGSLGKLNAFLVSGNFFEVLGIGMTRGRALLPDDDRPGRPQPVAVMGFAFWQSRFGGDPGIVGSALRVNDATFTVVGIASPEFVGPEPNSANLFLPVGAVTLLRPGDASAGNLLYAPDYCCSDLVARLARGSTREQARAELDVLSRSFRQEAKLETPGGASTRRVIVTGTEFLARPGRKNQPLAVVGVLSAGLLLVWLLACANVGNLQIARAAARAREIGVRLSLGASRGRVVRQLVTESLVLSTAASALGITVAYVLPKLVIRLAGGGDNAPFSLAPDTLVFVYAVLLAAASAAAFGLAPALQATRADVSSALKTPDGSGPAGVRLRTFLLGVQVAISVILLVSAGLLVRGAQQRSGSFDFGFAYDDVSVATFEVPVNYGTSRSGELLSGLTRMLESREDQRFAFAQWEPLANFRSITQIRVPGDARVSPAPTLFLEVTPGYFDVLRMPLVLGHGFSASDRPEAVIVNESLARTYWPGENPVGKAFLMRTPFGEVPREVLGVVRNAYTVSLDDVQPMLYARLTQPGVFGFPKLLVRGTGPADAADITQMAARLDSRVRVTTTPLSDRIAGRLQSSRYGAMLAAILGAFALILATVGHLRRVRLCRTPADPRDRNSACARSAAVGGGPADSHRPVSRAVLGTGSRRARRHTGVDDPAWILVRVEPVRSRRIRRRRGGAGCCRTGGQLSAGAAGDADRSCYSAARRIAAIDTSG